MVNMLKSFFTMLFKNVYKVTSLELTFLMIQKHAVLCG
jgi:hypothetical protein